MGPYDEFAKNRDPHLRVMRKHRDAAYEIDEHVEAGPARGGAAQLGRGGRARRAHGHRNAQATVLAPTGHDLLPDGLRHDRRRARLLAREDQGAGRRRPHDDREPHRATGAAAPRLRRRPDRADRGVRERAPHDPRRARIRDEHLPVFDVAVGERAISHMGHIQMMAAVQPFISGRDLEDGEHAGRVDRGGHQGRLPRGGPPGREGARDLPRRLEDRAGAAHRREGRARTLAAEAAVPAAQAPAARARLAHAQVLRRRPRGLHHRGPLRGRRAGRDLPDRHRQGRLDPARHDERVRDRDLDRPPVRRAAGDVREASSATCASTRRA